MLVECAWRVIDSSRRSKWVCIFIWGTLLLYVCVCARKKPVLEKTQKEVVEMMKVWLDLLIVVVVSIWSYSEFFLISMKHQPRENRPYCQILVRPIEIQVHIWDVRWLKLTRQQPRRFPLEWQKKKLRLDEMQQLKLHEGKHNMQQPNFHRFPPACVRMFSCPFDAVSIAWGQSKGRCHSSYQGLNLIQNIPKSSKDEPSVFIVPSKCFWSFEVSSSANLLRILISGRCSERSGWSPTGLGCSGSMPRCEKLFRFWKTLLDHSWSLWFFNDSLMTLYDLIWFRFLSFCFFPHSFRIIFDSSFAIVPFLPLQGGLPEKIEDDTHSGGYDLDSNPVHESWIRHGHGCAGQGASKSTSRCALGLWGDLRNANISKIFLKRCIQRITFFRLRFQLKPVLPLENLPIEGSGSIFVSPSKVKKNDPNTPGKKIDDYWETSQKDGILDPNL